MTYEEWFLKEHMVRYTARYNELMHRDGGVMINGTEVLFPEGVRMKDPMKRFIKKSVKSQIQLWDYLVEEWMDVPIGTPTDDKTALRFLPQTEGYREAYQVRRDLEYTPFEAFSQLLAHITGG